MLARKVLGGIGRTLIAAGLLVLLFVGYQVWGTNFSEARSQDRLRERFEAALGDEAAAPAADDPAPTPEGEAVAILKIPKLGVEKAVVEGVGVADLKKGPGHYPTTPMPGEPGNAAIAGHRTTYGAPFMRLDELVAGDPILVTTAKGRFRYEVRESQVVKPRQNEVLASTDDNRLTLTTCHPRYSARERLIVVATLVGEAVPAAEKRRREAELAADRAGLSGDPTARTPAVAWGLAAATVAGLIWVWGRFWRPWPAYLIGAPLFFVVLFVFYENVARLLPANV